MSEIIRKISAEAIASEETAAQGTVEPNNPTNENNEVNDEAPVASPQPEINTPELTEEEKQRVHETLRKFQSVSYEEFRGSCRLASDPRQRPIHESNVKILEKSIENHEAVMEPIRIVPVLRMVEEGEKLYLNGELITPDTPGIEVTYDVIDGGHRKEAVDRLKKKNPKMAIRCQFVVPDIPEGVTCRQYQDIINNERCAWTPSDRIKSVVKKNEGDGETICQLMEQWNSEYGVSFRESFAIFHFNDGYRKDKLVNSLNGELDEDLRGTPEQIGDGKQMFESLLVGCNGEKKLYGSLAAVKASIDIYNKAGKDKTKVVENLNLALRAIDEKDREKLRSCKNLSEREAEFGKILKSYIGQLNKEDSRSDVERKAQANAEAYQRKMSGKNEKGMKAVYDALKTRLGLKRLTRTLLSEIKSLVAGDDVEQVIAFINGLTENQATDFRAYGREATGSDRLNEVVTKAWNEFVENPNQNN